MLLIAYQNWLDEILSGINVQVYMIEMRKHQHKWWFLQVEQKKEDLFQVMWTPSIKKGHIFLTEEIVEEFKSNYISPRKASIIRVPAMQALKDMI